MLEALLDRIRGKKTAAEYESAIEEINRQLDALRGHLAVHGAALTAAVFEATPKEVADLQAKRRATEDEISLLEAALEGAQARLDAAVAAERDDEIAELQRQGREARDRLRKAGREYDKAIEAVIAAGRVMFRASTEVSGINTKIETMGRPEARLRFPMMSMPFESTLPGAITQLQNNSPTATFESFEAQGKL